MPPPTSNFLRSGQPDQRLAQTATTIFDATARQVLDQQVVDMQTALAAILVNGVVGTYATLDGSYTDAAAGDVVCLGSSTSTTIVRAETTELAAAGCVVGILLETSPAGSRALVGTLGIFGPSVTGLATGAAGPVRVSSAGRPEKVAALLAGDFGLGAVDSNGRLMLSPDSGAFATAASVSFADVKAALAAANTAVDFNGQKITGVDDPTTATGAATKQFVEAAYTNGAGLNLAAGSFSAIYGLVGEIGNVAAADVAAAGTTDKAARIDHKHAVDSSSTGTASKLAAYGSSSQLVAASFRSTGTVAGTGILRAESGSIPIAAKDSANADAALADWSGADVLTLGNAASAAQVILAAKAAASVIVALNSVTKLTVDGKGVGVGSTFSAGAGSPVLFLENTTANPSSNPSGGLVTYSDAGAATARSPNGALTTMAPLGASATTLQYGWFEASVQTTDATPTLLLRITVPANVIGRISYSVMGRKSDSGNWYERISRVRNSGGTAVLVDTLTPVADREDTDPALDISITQTSDKIDLTVTGKAATTLDWTVSARTEFYAP